MNDTRLGIFLIIFFSLFLGFCLYIIQSSKVIPERNQKKELSEYVTKEAIYQTDQNKHFVYTGTVASVSQKVWGSEMMYVHVDIQYRPLYTVLTCVKDFKPGDIAIVKQYSIESKPEAIDFIYLADRPSTQ